mgnify:CR=1 FL=1
MIIKLALMDMQILIKEIGTPKNYTYPTKLNKFSYFTMSQFVFCPYLQQNQINLKYLLKL